MGELQIISRSHKPFTDREEAGMFLGRRLRKLKNEDPVIVGILRGGIVVAREIAEALNAEMDVMLSRKISAPYNPELAIGAISETGNLFLNERILRYMNVPSSYITQEKEKQMAIIAERISFFRENYPKINLTGRHVIITDDGVATGATMQATIWSVKQEMAKKITIALPVGPEDSLRKLATDADMVICLQAPELFSAVGQFYYNFDQTEDEEVLRILNDVRERVPESRAVAPSLNQNQ